MDLEIGLQEELAHTRRSLVLIGGKCGATFGEGGREMTELRKLEIKYAELEGRFFVARRSAEFYVQESARAKLMLLLANVFSLLVLAGLPASPTPLQLPNLFFGVAILLALGGISALALLGWIRELKYLERLRSGGEVEDVDKK